MRKTGIYISLLKPYRPRIAVFLLLYLLSCAGNLFLPYIMGEAINELNGAVDVYRMLALCGIMAGVAVVSLVSMICAVRISASVSTSYVGDLRTAIFAHACNISTADVNRIGVAAMLDRSTYDILTLMDFIPMALRAAITVPVYSVVGCVMAFRIDGILASIMVVCIPLIVIMIFGVTRLVQPLMKRSHKYLDIQNAIVHERLSGIRVIRAFNREPYEHKRMADATDVMADNFVKTNVATGSLTPIAMLVMNTVTILILYFGGSRVSAGAAIAVGDIEQLIQYVGMIMNALFSAAFAVMMFPRIRVGVGRMNEVFDCKQLARGDGNKTFDGTVSAVGVSYRYDGGSADALLPVTFDIKKGERVALIGGTGSGKTTLLTMLAGLARPTGGALALGGYGADSLTVDEISKNVTTVFQKSDFFTATLRENVDPSGKHTDDEIFSALDCAELGDFSRRVGLDYGITQGGGNLSGGQKQRVALARAFLKDASIFLFDDSFSALDYLTERKVRANISERLAGKTCVIATQRVSTALGCDKILLFDGGRLVASGTHEELLKNPIYNEIYMSQTGGRLA